MGKWSTPKKRKSTPNKSPIVRVKVTPRKTPTVTHLISRFKNDSPSPCCEKSPSSAKPEWLQARIQVILKFKKVISKSHVSMSVPLFSRLVRCPRVKSREHWINPRHSWANGAVRICPTLKTFTTSREKERQWLLSLQKIWVNLLHVKANWVKV